MASTQNFRSGGRTWSMPRIDTRIGFTQIDTMALAACSVILLTLAVAQAGRINKVARRTVCAANIRGVMQSMFTYAQTNDSCFPAVTAPIKGHYENAPGNQLRGEGLPAEVLKALYRPSPPPLTPREKKEKPLIFAGGKPRTAVHCGSPLACMWILVLQNYVTTKSFICPADQFGTVPSIEYAAVTPKGTLFPSNFGLLGTVQPHMRRAVIPGHGESYSIAYPWQGKNVAPWWTDNDGANVPLVSDMAPAMDIHERGKKRQEYRDPTDPKHHPKYKWAFNTGNHDGAGQNVGYGDDHVSWCTTPYVGVKGVNIFTYDSPHHVHPSLGGGKVLKPGRSSACPTHLPKSMPYAIVMAPVRNVATGAW